MTHSFAASANPIYASVLMLLALLAAGASEAAGPPIYKCVQGDGAVLYTDYPCKGGEVLEIHPGVADPAAGERLAYARAELERGAAMRNASEATAAALREEAIRRRLAGESSWGPMDAPASFPEAADGLAWGSYGVFVPHRPRSPGSEKRSEHRRSDGVAPSSVRRHQAVRSGNNTRPFKG